MGYLEPTEYAAYGLTAETTDDWVATASALMEGYCQRPTLLLTDYTERMRVMAGACAVRLSYGPLMADVGATTPLLGVRVRLGAVRRGEPIDPGLGLSAVLGAEAAMFGAAAIGSWTTLDVATVDVDAATGELTLPGNLLGLRAREVEVHYTAGVVTVPVALKVACAQIVRNAQSTPGLTVKASKVDSLQMQYFGGSLLDADVRSLLRPYIARKVGG